MSATPRVFFGITALAFLVSATVTVAWCGSMSDMPGMAMPGGWTMSMAWMRMPGQSWSSATGTFLGMWAVMMIAMMLPTASVELWRRRATLRLTTVTLSGYFTIWILTGVLAWPLGMMLAEAAMYSAALSRTVPLLAALGVLGMGLLQASAWKSRQLHCCARLAHASSLRESWRQGMNLGLQCVRCCLPHTTLLLVLGVMDLRAMALVTVAITAERLAPAGPHLARGVGVLMVVGGLGSLAALVT